MALFSRKQVICPVCGKELLLDKSDRNGFGHFATHLDDTAGPGSPLRFACGCSEAVFEIAGDFPNQVLRHLKQQHKLKLPV